MADAEQSAQQDGKQADASKQQDGKQAVASQDDKTVPYSRFKEVNDQLRDFKAKEEARQAEEAKKQEDEAKKRGEYESLLKQRDEELSKLKAFHKERTEADNAERESLLSQLNDEDKEIGSDLSLTKLRTFVTKQKSPPPPANPKGEPGGGRDETFKPLPGENAFTYGQRVSTLKRAKH